MLLWPASVEQQTARYIKLVTIQRFGRVAYHHPTAKSESINSNEILQSAYSSLNHNFRYYNFTELACQLNEMEEGVAPTDSRLRPDQRLMEEGRWEESNQEKIRYNYYFGFSIDFFYHLQLYFYSSCFTTGLKRNNALHVENERPKPNQLHQTRWLTCPTNHYGLRKSKTKTVKVTITWCTSIKAITGRQRRMAIGNNVQIFFNINFVTANIKKAIYNCYYYTNYFFVDYFLQFETIKNVYITEKTTKILFSSLFSEKLFAWNEINVLQSNWIENVKWVYNYSHYSINNIQLCNWNEVQNIIYCWI